MALLGAMLWPYDKAATLRVWTGIGDVVPPAVEQVKRALGEQSNRRP